MEHNQIFQPVLILLVSAILGLALVHRFRLSPILGYFLAGILVGPYSLGLVDNSVTIQTMAEIGVAFLLFDIGLHLSFRTLWESRREFLGLSPFQIIGTSVLIGGIAWLFTRDFLTSFIIGSGLSLSSTAVAIQTLREKKEENTPVGRSALAILIAQDIFVVFLLILMPSLASGKQNWLQPLGFSMLKALLALGLVSLVGRFLLRPLFEWITATKSDDLFTEFALLFVLATAWGVSQLGLSLPLGAFLAGLALSESDFCYLVKTEIYPFRGLLLGLFFITVGMSLNWPLALQYALPIVGLVLGLVAVKMIALWAAARLMRFCSGGSIYLAFVLAQGSEFSFVLFSMAIATGLLNQTLGQLLQVAVGITLALTPLLALAGCKLGNRIENLRVETNAEAEDLLQGPSKVIIAGFDLIGEELAKILEAERISYIAYDSNRNRVAEARSRGFQVDFSDINRPRTAGAASAGRARAVVVLFDDPEVSLYLINILRQMHLDIPIYAAAREILHYNQLSELGITEAFHKSAQTVSLIAADLLKRLGFSELQVTERLERIQREQEPVLKEAFTPV